METLRKIAEAHYQAASDEVRVLAHKFFKELDFDGDGKIDYKEFLLFLRQEGRLTMTSRYMFNELDADGNGTLDFWEAVTLYYIIRSGRPFCDNCKTFAAKVFFTCVACYESPGDTFNLCLDCYGSGTYDHLHDGRSQFLDCCTMVFNMRNSVISAKLDNPNQPSGHQTSNTGITKAQSFRAESSTTGHAKAPPQRSYSSNAIDSATRKSRMSAALKAFEIALSVGSISTSLCQIL